MNGEPAGRGRSVLRIPRVEFDLAALLLGTVAWACLTFAWPVLAWALAVPADGTKILGPGGPRDAAPAEVLRFETLQRVREVVRAPGVAELTSLLGHPGQLLRPSERAAASFEPARVDVEGWKIGAAAAALLLVWSVLAGAVARVYALRKARDESIRFDDALAYAFGNLGQFLKAPLFTAAAVALAAAVVLACGALSGVPWAGPALQVVAQPVALAAGLFLVVLVLGLLFGFPMMTAAVAVERGGSLDAVSRTFSYVWTRPVAFLLTAGLVVLIAGVLGAVAEFTLSLAWTLFVGGAGLVDGELAPRLAAALRAAGTLGSPDTAGAPGLHAASVWIAWAVGAVATLAAHGLVFSYLVGGIVDVYFLLREEVDQVGPQEVFVEGAGATLGDPVPGEPRAGPAG